LKKWDKIIIFAVLFAAVVCFLIFMFTGKNGSKITVSENNKVVYEGSLSVDKTIELAGNTVEIKNGKASVVSAKCKNQICVNHSEISQKGESIICLPNSVIVEIK